MQFGVLVQVLFWGAGAGTVGAGVGGCGCIFVRFTGWVLVQVLCWGAGAGAVGAAGDGARGRGAICERLAAGVLWCRCSFGALVQFQVLN